MRKPKTGSAILAAVHEAAADLHAAGALDPLTMRRFDVLCLPPVRACSKFKVARAATVWANLPPARIWLYSPAH